MHTRDYNKIYVNKNREEGSEKLFLGYQNTTTEYPLFKDRETYFHIPPYTTPVSLADSSLIIDGATGGAFPAVSDRIFESRKNYGNVSNNGSPSEVPDGTWFCSWLYKNPQTGQQQWFDRYFDPKTINYNPETLVGSTYILNAPPSFDVTVKSVIYDVPSATVLEPSVLYRYFHIGEKTAQEILTTFGGVSGERLLLDITNWKSQQTNTQGYPITVTSSVSSSSLFPLADGTQVILFSALGFEHNQNVEAYIPWDSSYIPSHDFTLGVWCQSSDWNNCPSTQIAGNYSAKGGFGIFVDTLKTYPYFIVPETTYGHLLLFNQESQGFLDKVVVSQLSSLSLHIPSFVALDSNECLVVCSSGTNSSPANLYKMDHVGNLLQSTTLSFTNETIISMMVDRYDSILVTTDQHVYKYDNALQLKTTVSQPLTLPTGRAASAFSYNTTALSSILVTKPDAIDLKFIGETAWSILTDGNVYKNETLFLSANITNATNLQIDPNGNIWILHGNNNVSVYDPNGSAFQDPLLTFTVGTDFDTHTQKFLSFINVYDRKSLSEKWVSVIYYNDSHYIYTNTLDGKVNDVVDITPFIDAIVSRQLQQDPEKYIYGTKGDFTGYEYKRVFKSLNPHKQLVIKAALKDNLTNKYTYKIFKRGVSIDNNSEEVWDSHTWKHIILTHKNRTFTLYFNGVYQTSFQYSGRYELTFDQQPSLWFGSPVGARNGLNKEIQSITSLFNGAIGDVKFYDYSIDPIHFDMFLRAGISAEDMLWSLPIPSVSYIERIERMFKNKLPGSKSGFYNIKLAGTNITDLNTRVLIEEQIKKIIQEISPAYADLVKIIWI